MVFRKNPNVITSTAEGRSRGVPYGGNGFNVGVSLVSQLGVPFDDPTIMTMEAKKYELKYDPKNNSLIGANVTRLPLDNC